MNLEQLRALVSEGESDTLEFKRSTAQLQRAGETLCAFLNGAGGRVLIGVSNDGTIVGQTVAEGTHRDITRMLTGFEPPAPITIELTPIEPESDRSVIILTAPPSNETRPFTFRARAYQRRGAETMIMPQQTYNNLLLARTHMSQRWENADAENYELDDLDADVILRTIRIGKENRRIPETVATNPMDFLTRMKLIADGRALQAAVVLFGTQFLPYYPQCHIRMARFRGTDKTEFIDNKQVRGNIFTLLDEASQFLNRHIAIAGKIVPDQLERIDTPQYPTAALREALVNALCHRDYSIAGGSVSIAIYDDRLEIWNDGTLPVGLHVEDLKKDHLSRPRNPIIAGILYRCKLIEMWGRGTQDIVKACLRHGLPEPEFIEEAGSFGVRFFRKITLAERIHDQSLTAIQSEIVSILSETDQLSLKQIVAQLTSPPSIHTVRQEIYALRDMGLIELHGKTKGAKWSIHRSLKEG